MGKFTLENEILLNVCKRFTAYDYIAAQKVAKLSRFLDDKLTGQSIRGRANEEDV